MKLVDLTDQRFGRLVVLNRAPDRIRPSGQRVTYWRCACDCGEESDVAAGSLQGGTTRSCGCKELKRERTGRRAPKTEQFDRPRSLELGDLDVDIVLSDRNRNS